MGYGDLMRKVMTGIEGIEGAGYFPFGKEQPKK